MTGKYRAVHLDLKNCMPDFGYLLSVLEKLAGLGANAVLLEYEDKFPYRKHREIVHPLAFTRPELTILTDRMRSLGMEVIPLVQSLGHVEYVLKHEAHRELREVSDSDWQYCSGEDKVLTLLLDLYREVLEVHPEASLIHLGCDETWNLGRCPRCRKESPAANFASWINRLNQAVQVEFPGKRIVIWNDMLGPLGCTTHTSVYRDYPYIAEVLSKDIVLCYWDYWNTRTFPYLDFYREKGFQVMNASAVSDQVFPNYRQRIPNIVGFARRSAKCEHVIGDLITCWTWGTCVPLELHLFGFGVGLKTMQSPERDTREIEREVLEQLYGIGNEGILDAMDLLSGLPSEADAPWKLLAFRQAQSILKKTPGDSAFAALLFFVSELMIHKASCIIETYGGKDMPSELKQERLSLREKAGHLYKPFFRDLSERDLDYIL